MFYQMGPCSITKTQSDETYYLSIKNEKKIDAKSVRVGGKRVAYCKLIGIESCYAGGVQLTFGALLARKLPTLRSCPTFLELQAAN